MVMVAVEVNGDSYDSRDSAVKKELRHDKAYGVIRQYELQPFSC
jgi:hypothetical protein